METSHKTITVAAIAIAAVIVGGAYYVSRYAAAPVSDIAVLATPVGITLQPLGVAQGYGQQSRLVFLPREEIAFADAKGMTLYSYDGDQPDKSLCTGDCAKDWIPLAAGANAQPVGDWSIVVRADGTRQWAHGHRPLYTYAGDTDIGSIGGSNPRPPPPYSGNPMLPPKPLPPEWHVALLYPVAGMKLPVGIAVREVADAQGLALVDERGRTLYGFDGDANRDRPTCSAAPCTDWTPFAAPQIAGAVGDFAFVVRDDGVKQWTYRGKALYAYRGDLAVADANGIGVDRRMTVARIVRYFMPPNVTIRNTPGRGDVLATANGMTLYRRDGFAFQSGGGHSLRHGVPIRPAVGRDIGAKGGCDADCLKVWHPYAAPAGAQPSGYWSVAARDDGTAQWVYQGYALWTYDGDKHPGDVTGNDLYDIALSDDPNKVNRVDTQMDGVAALFWSVAEP